MCSYYFYKKDLRCSQYFFRELDPERLSTCKWEFVGRKAPEEIRKLYVGKIIKKDSLGMLSMTWFLRVGATGFEPAT